MSKVGKNKVVTLTYELSLPKKESTPVVDKADNEKPFSFVFGADVALESFEKNIEGLKPGDDFEFEIASGNAYGEYKEEAVVNLPKNIFQVDGEVRDDLLEPGRVLPMKDQEGNHYEGQVMEIKEEEVVMNFNHPLAGQDLHFKGRIEDLREATDEEVENGEVSGSGSAV
jgi:FKBP-type peptidyl-prolyl cis-trans isomerase SlyD